MILINTGNGKGKTTAPKKVRRAKLYFVRDLSKKKTREKIGIAA